MVRGNESKQRLPVTHGLPVGVLFVLCGLVKELECNLVLYSSVGKAMCGVSVKYQEISVFIRGRQ